MNSDVESQQKLSEELERERRRLMLLAYRMTGSWTDAEDVVQTAVAECLGAPVKVQNLAGWLTRVTVRRSIDALRSRIRQPNYVGLWLPEPLVVEKDGPFHRLEESMALSTAFLVLAESLTPPQRAVVMLRTLGYVHAEIADALQISIVASRQHHSRAIRILGEVNGRRIENDPGLGLRSSDGQAREETRTAEDLLIAYLDAARLGDVQSLIVILHEQVIAYQDGGGKVSAALRALLGPSNVARFTTGVARLHLGQRSARPVTVGGTLGVLLSLTETRHVISVQIRDGLIYRLFDVCNPEKHGTLSRLPVAL